MFKLIIQKQNMNSFVSRPRVRKAFQNQDQDQAQVKQPSTMDFL